MQNTDRSQIWWVEYSQLIEKMESTRLKKWVVVEQEFFLLILIKN